METIILVLQALWPLAGSFAIVAVMWFGLVAVLPEYMRKTGAIGVSGMLFIALATAAYERYDLLKSYPEDIVIFTDSKLKSILRYEYLMDYHPTNSHWDCYQAHRYYQSYARHMSDGEELRELLKNHEVVSVEYLPAGESFVLKNKDTGKIITKTFMSKQNDFIKNHKVLSVDDQSVVCKHKKTDKIVTLKRELSPLTNWESI